MVLQWQCQNFLQRIKIPSCYFNESGNWMFPNILVELRSCMWEGDFCHVLSSSSQLWAVLEQELSNWEPPARAICHTFAFPDLQWECSGLCATRESTDTLNLKAALFQCSFKSEDWWMASSHKFLLYNCLQQESDAFLNMLWLLLVFVLALKKGN